MAENVEPDLVDEFKDLLRTVTEDVSKAAIVPAVEAAQATWTAKLDHLLSSAQTNQRNAQAKFDAAFQRVLEEAKASQDILGKAAGAEAAVVAGVKSFIEQASKTQLSVKQATTDLENACKSACKVSAKLRDDFAESASSATEQLNTTLGNILSETKRSFKQATTALEDSCQSTCKVVAKFRDDFAESASLATEQLNTALGNVLTVEKDFSAKAGKFSEEFSGQLKAVQMLLNQAENAFKESQRPVLFGLTPRTLLATTLVCNVLLLGAVLVIVTLRLAGARL